MSNLPFVVACVLAASPVAAQTPTVESQQHAKAQKAYELGQELMQRESFEEAAIHFKTAIKLDPMHWLAHYGLGQANMALKRYPEAVQAYLGCQDVLVNAAALDAAQQNTMNKLREEEIQEVRETLVRVQQGKIKTGSPLSLEVQLQDRLRVLEGSRLRGKEQKVGVPAGLMLGLGSAYFRSGQLAAAQTAFLEAVEIDPNLGPAHNNLAVMYMMSGDFTKAKEEVRRAEKAGTRVADAFKQELERRARAGEEPR